MTTPETPTTYQPQTFESKWIATWAKERIYATPTLQDGDKKQYVLDMFPYPSGAGLHVGHVEGYTATDIYSRYMRMKGHSVLHPMGFDSFGLPAENFAVKTGTHPKITTEKAIETFTEQMKALGLSYDWDLTLAAHRPDYYKWTQWLFLLMHKRGLAYRKKQAVNWCSGCQTVLANEQVVDGKCERCETEVVQKEMEQWFLKITDYAERLLADLDKLDWPESTKAGQRNWIGKSEGINIKYRVQGTEYKVEVFTTRPDTNFGATFLVCAPDSEFVREHLSAFPNSKEVKQYAQKAMKKRELERVGTERKKTGVFTGWNAVNELNGKELPIYVADFALGSVGTGCLVGVPGHDKRDFEFVKEYDLPIVRVVVASDGKTDPITDIAQVQEDEGTMINSGFLDGMDIHRATEKIMDYMVEKGYGTKVTNYKLRDWLISRQRFWGAPIPMRKYKVQGTGYKGEEWRYEPVEESELPVVLPMDAKFKPTGKSPLTEHPDFANREVDTMDTFVDSSWYFLRFAQLTSNTLRAQLAGREEKENPFEDISSKALMNTWCPVDLYVGGAEHTVLHLLYSRFFTKVLFDAGYVNFDEPFLKLRHQGIIVGPDNRKMSKRWGNVINPLDVISQYGADTLRMYEMFMGPFDQVKTWNVRSVAGIYRFLSRVWRLAQENMKTQNTSTTSHPEVKTALHKTIAKITKDTPELKFNTAIASAMEFVNVWEKYKATSLIRKDLEKFILILAPYASFMTEELWHALGHTDSVHTQVWPDFDPTLLTSDVIEIPVQINGKMRGTITLDKNEATNETRAIDLARENPAIAKYLTDEVRKVIYVQGKILNIVCK